MTAADFWLLMWLAGAVVAFFVSLWMSWDLWLDLQALFKTKRNGLARAMVKKDLRLEIISSIKALCIGGLCGTIAVFSWSDQSTGLEQWIVEHSQTLVRVFGTTMIWLLPLRAIADRVTRARALGTIERKHYDGS